MLGLKDELFHAKHPSTFDALIKVSRVDPLSTVHALVTRLRHVHSNVNDFVLLPVLRGRFKLEVFGTDRRPEFTFNTWLA